MKASCGTYGMLAGRAIAICRLHQRCFSSAQKQLSSPHSRLTCPLMIPPGTWYFQVRSSCWAVFSGHCHLCFSAAREKEPLGEVAVKSHEGVDDLNGQDDDVCIRLKFKRAYSSMLILWVLVTCLVALFYCIAVVKLLRSQVGRSGIAAFLLTGGALALIRSASLWVVSSHLQTHTYTTATTFLS